MRDFNYMRVIHYDRHSWPAGAFGDRIGEILPMLATEPIKSINDAIEAHQSKLTVENIPELFDKRDLPMLRDASFKAFKNACRYVRTSLQENGIQSLYEDLEQQYIEQFWELLGSCGAENITRGEDLEALLSDHSSCLKYVLEIPAFVKRYDDNLRSIMMGEFEIAAELVISRLATVSTGSFAQRPITLPRSLTNDDLDEIMLAYLNGGHSNSNYVEVLTRWPDRLVSPKYRPSPDVRVKAKRVYAESMHELFTDGNSMHSITEVIIDMEQQACRSVNVDGLNLTWIFSGQWLEAYMDSATVMNNCRWIFDFMDARGLMQMPAHAYEESGVVAMLGIRVCGEYRENPASCRRGNSAFLETGAYAEFLERHGHSLEEALEWVYASYFPDEFGISGFGISLPRREGSWLDRCKGIGSEIERAMKEYQLYAKRGSIEDDYFDYEQFKSFASVPALCKRKYAIAGEGFETWASPLFSDQSPLIVYVVGKKSNEPSFFDLMLSEGVTREDYQEPLCRSIDHLIEKGFICEDSATGQLKPTPQAYCLRLIWRFGGVVLKRYRNERRKAIDGLVAQGILKYHDGLFTPDEVSYLNYMLNDSEQTNALGLRNKYSHASGPVRDPNTDEMRFDYYTMLALLVTITLKINDELMDKTGKGAIDDFVDWPLYDESVFEAVRLTGCEKKWLFGDLCGLMPR